VNQALIQRGGDVTAARNVRLVRLRAGVYATGAAVGERQPPPRLVHVVDIAADLDAPEGVISSCGVRFAAGTLMEVPSMTTEPHPICRRLSTPAHPCHIQSDTNAANEELPDP
jgi:hypothetical protein